MSIKAFVGHSFLQVDAEVVRKFLDFFNHVSELGLDFSWEHAESAEPKELSIKVKEKMEGKNLFIGICTSRQRSIDFDKLSSFPFYKNKLWANHTDFLTKTSDWILQEIGFAYGRDMKIMILLEKGVTKPGGIQGDIEYIDFDRNIPERSFTKILEMLRSLTKLPVTKDTIEKVESEKSIQQMETERTEEIKEERPMSEWTKEDYENQIFSSILRKDESKEEEIHKNFVKTSFGSNPIDLAEWNARRLHLRMYFRKENHLSDLFDLLDQHPENSIVLLNIAESYEIYNEYERAADYYQKSSKNTDDKEQKIIRLAMASLAFARSGDKQKANALNKECILMIRELGKGTSFIYKSLADVAIEIGNVDDYKVFTEAYLELSPEDHGRRFDLAYKYSENNENDASSFHYRILTERNPNKSNWHNLGVAFHNLKLQSLSVYAYREAEKMGETLSMNNLAHRFISEGFLDEATNLVNKATSIENYDERIGTAIASIKETKEKEEKERSKLINLFKKIRQFYVDYSKSYLKEDLQSAPLEWISPKCGLELRIDKDNFEAIGFYEKTKSTPAWLSTGEKVEKIKEYVKYVGKISGYSIKCQYWISTNETIDIDKAKAQGTCLMIVDDDIQKIRVYELGTKTEEGFSEFIVDSNQIGDLKT